MKLNAIIIALLLLVAAPLAAQTGSQTVRIKDIVTYKGAARNIIQGEGLVIGLKGTGDKDSAQAAVAAKSLVESKEDSKYLERMTPADFANENIAWVSISAEVTEATTIAGSRLTATVAIKDKATSLVGGMLVMSNLSFGHRDDDTRGTIAVAGGLLNTGVAGGGGAAGRQQASTTATVEATLMIDLPEITFFETSTDAEGNISKTMTLILRAPDAQTAHSIAQAINDSAPRLGNNRVGRGEMARAASISSVVVTIPKDYHGREVEFRHHIERESVNPDLAAMVHVNRVNRTLVVSGNVRVLPCVLVVGGVQVITNPQGDSPAKPEPGAEVIDPSISVNQPATPLQDMFAVFDALGMSVEDKIKAVEALDKQGSLQGKLVID